MDKYLFFYSASATNGYLSNFSKHKFIERDQTFHSVEQYMHYHKALLMNDEDTAEEILLANTPYATKILGRNVKNFNQKIWDLNKKQIVKQGIMLKFKQNPGIQKRLLETSPKLLVEAAGGRNGDKIWGIGFDSSEAMDNIDKWGLNLLGQILTEVRDEIASD